jgi:hypothetical protein
VGKCLAQPRSDVVFHFSWGSGRDAAPVAKIGPGFACS